MNDAAAVPLFARLTLVGLVWFGWTARIFKTTMAILGRRRLRRRRCFDPVVVGWTLSSFPPPSPPRTSMRPSCYRAHGRGINLQLAILTTSVIVVSSNFVWRREGSTRAQNTRMWWWVGQNGDRHSIGLVRSYYSVSVCQTIVIEACKWRRTFLLFFFFSPCCSGVKCRARSGSALLASIQQALAPGFMCAATRTRRDWGISLRCQRASQPSYSIILAPLLHHHQPNNSSSLLHLDRSSLWVNHIVIPRSLFHGFDCSLQEGSEFGRTSLSLDGVWLTG